MLSILTNPHILIHISEILLHNYKFSMMILHVHKNPSSSSQCLQWSNGVTEKLPDPCPSCLTTRFPSSDAQPLWPFSKGHYPYIFYFVPLAWTGFHSSPPLLRSRGHRAHNLPVTNVISEYSHFNSEEGGSIYLPHISIFPQNYTMSTPRRLQLNNHWHQNFKTYEICELEGGGGGAFKAQWFLCVPPV
jgi:hypothetical protein